MISFYVPCELWLPVFGPRFRFRCKPTARVLVPEAAMHEDGDAVLRKNDIRLSGQILAVQAESETSGMEKLTNGKFGDRVLRSDA